MSGAHGVAGWVWGGGGWVSVDRRLFNVVASGWFWSCRVLYDEIYIMIIEK